LGAAAPVFADEGDIAGGVNRGGGETDEKRLFPPGGVFAQGGELVHFVRRAASLGGSEEDAGVAIERAGPRGAPSGKAIAPLGLMLRLEPKSKAKIETGMWAGVALADDGPSARRANRRRGPWRWSWWCRRRTGPLTKATCPPSPRTGSGIM